MQPSLPMHSRTLTDRPRRTLRDDEALASPPLLRSGGESAPLGARTWQGLFGAQGPNTTELAALSSVARLRTVAAGGSVFDHGHPATALVLAASGDVALGWRGSDGVFHIERPVRGPAWLDQSAAWLEQPHAMDARATGDVLIAELPCAAVRALLERHPGLARHLLASLAREVHGLTMNTHELMHKDAPARFAAWLLLRLPASSAGSAGSTASGGSAAPLLRLGERKRDIASQLAITPETLSRLMRSLSRQGLISVAGYSVQVLDVAGLQRLAESG